MSKKIGQKDLVSAAQEMNKVMGLEPPIGQGQNLSKMDTEDLEKEIKEQAEEVRAEDNFSAKTWDVLEALGVAQDAIEERKEDSAKAGKEDGESDEDEDAGDKKDSDEDDEDEPETDEDDEDEKPAKGKGKEAVKKTEKKAEAPAKEAKKVSPPQKTEKAPEPVKASKKGVGKPGVIQAIVDMLKKKPHTKVEILASLSTKFKDRDPEKMKKTVGVQVPFRLKSDKGLKVMQDDKGRFYIK